MAKCASACRSGLGYVYDVLGGNDDEKAVWIRHRVDSDWACLHVSFPLKPSALRPGTESGREACVLAPLVGNGLDDVHTSL